MTNSVDDKDAKSPGPERTASETRGIARRELLKRLSATGAAVGAVAPPAVWSRPVVDSVILPAHAQTTFGEGFYGSDFIQAFGRAADPDAAPRSLLDSIVQQAHAGEDSSESSEWFIEGFLSGDSNLILALSAVGDSQFLEELTSTTPSPACQDEYDRGVAYFSSMQRWLCFTGKVNSETPTELSVSGNCLGLINPSLESIPGGPSVSIVSSSADAVEIQIEDGPGGEGAPLFLTLVPGGTAPDCSCNELERLIEDAESCNTTTLSPNVGSMTESSTFDGHA